MAWSSSAALASLLAALTAAFCAFLSSFCANFCAFLISFCHFLATRCSWIQAMIAASASKEGLTFALVLVAAGVVAATGIVSQAGLISNSRACIATGAVPGQTIVKRCNWVQGTVGVGGAISSMSFVTCSGDAHRSRCLCSCGRLLT